MVAASSNGAVRSVVALAMDVAACSDVAPLTTKVATQGHRQMDQAPGTKGHQGEIPVLGVLRCGGPSWRQKYPHVDAGEERREGLAGRDTCPVYGCQRGKEYDN